MSWCKCCNARGVVLCNSIITLVILLWSVFTGKLISYLAQSEKYKITIHGETSANFSGIFLLPHNSHLSGYPHPVTAVLCMHTNTHMQWALSCELHVNTICSPGMGSPGAVTPPWPSPPTQHRLSSFYSPKFCFTWIWINCTTGTCVVKHNLYTYMYIQWCICICMYVW